MKIRFQYDFRPVGQGLFGSGHLERTKPGATSSTFRWVYDCGAEQGKNATHLDREVNLFNEQTGGSLQLVIVSHFDEDHIAGLGRLLQQHRTKWLVLPYLAPVDRLLILAATADASEAFTQFIVEPATYLRTLPGAEDADIVFIRESDDAAPPPQRLPAFDPRRDHDGNFEEPPEKSAAAEFPDDPDMAQSRVYLVPDSNTFRALGLWEFVFFNRPLSDERRRRAAIRKQIEPLFTVLSRQPAEQRDYASFVQSLKAEYDKVFGSSSAQRNIISLCCYTGPLLPRLEQTSYSPWLSSYSAAGPDSSAGRPQADRFYRMIIRERGKISLLHTGDITLRKLLLPKLKEHLGDQRWNQIEFLQVPHHGAETSWPVGTAASFTHSFSIFSSGRYNQYGHPHEPVVTELADYGPTFVDEFTGAHWGGTATWRE